MTTRPRHTLRFCLAAFYMDFSGGMFLVALPYLAMRFGAESFDLGVLGSVRGAAYVVACVFASMIADRRDRRLLIALSTAGMVVMLAATGAANSFWMLAATVMLWAFSLSFYWPSLFGWLGDAHGAEGLTTATGAVNLSWSVGSALGSLLGGYLFKVWLRLPFFVAVVPALLACLAMWTAGRGSGVPVQPEAVRGRPGTRRELLSAWVGNAGACCMLGLMTTVFPRLGESIGITAERFGLLMGGLGAGQAVIFLIGLRWGARLHGLWLAGAAQCAAAVLVATTAWASSTAWLAVVFTGLGLTIGVTYYRGLYKSLEGEGSRSFKSGMHEASLLVGVLIGSLGGGVLARGWGMRAPYLPLACVVLVLLAVQVALVVSAGRARTPVVASVET